MAVNLRHNRIEADDITKGVEAYSSDLVVDIGYEIRDVFPAAEDVLLVFIEAPQTLPESDLKGLFAAAKMEEASIPSIVDLLLWYGVLGVRRLDGSITYIYSPTINYEMPILKGVINKLRQSGLVYVINPAFLPALQVKADAA